MMINNLENEGILIKIYYRKLSVIISSQCYCIINIYINTTTNVVS